MRVWFVVPVALAATVGCSNSGLVPPNVDNPDALEPIPEAPPVDDREDQEQSPYAPPAPGEQDDDPPAEEPPPEEPPAEEPPAEEPPEDEQPVEQPPEDPPAPPPSGCPAGVVCVDSFPFVQSNTTVGGSDLFDSYACAPSTNESGPERLYEVEVTEPGFLAVTIWGLPAGVDVDVHLLGSADPNDCLDRGHWDAARFVEPGTYVVVADSWVSGSGAAQAGSYSIRIHHTPIDALAGDGLSSTVMERALRIFDTAWVQGDTSRLLYTVADFSQSSANRRLWTFDLANGDLLFHEHVAHGSGSAGSNPAMVAQMSNVNGSHMSSVGLFRTAETYQGSNGYSMRFDGLEPGFNDLVRSRAIVMHEADYATASFVASNGYLGRSWGCPAVDPAINADLIDTIKDGTLFLSHFAGDTSWLNQSDYL